MSISGLCVENKSKINYRLRRHLYIWTHVPRFGHRHLLSKETVDSNRTFPAGSSNVSSIKWRVRYRWFVSCDIVEVGSKDLISDILQAQGDIIAAESSPLKSLLLQSTVLSA